MGRVSILEEKGVGGYRAKIVREAPKVKSIRLRTVEVKRKTPNRELYLVKKDFVHYYTEEG